MRTWKLAAWSFVLLLGTSTVVGAQSGALLVEAARDADTESARILLVKGADPNAASPDGTAALHWAVHRNNLAMVNLLLTAGADAKAANRYAVTPLSLACENGNVLMIRRLLEAGADPNAVEGDGETALMTAARTGNADAVNVLLANGADVDATERWRGQTALMFAAIENNGAAALELLKYGAKLSVRSTGGFTALLFAVRGGHIETVRVLLTAGARLDETLPDGSGVLHLAVVNAHYELGSFLLDHGADPNADAVGWTPLHQVAMTRRPNTGGNLTGAIPTGRIDSLALAEKLIARGADPNARQTKEYPKTGYLAGYRQLLNRNGATPFLIAAWAVDVEFMRVLAANGADPLRPNAENTTPLMAAAGVGIWSVGESPGTNEEALEAVRLCLELGGDVTAVDDYGYTALHGAAHRGANPIVQLLVERGAKLDAKLVRAGGGDVGWKEGWTPLMIAEGVFYANTYKRYPQTAALLRRLMQDRGVAVERAPLADGGSVATTKPQ